MNLIFALALFTQWTSSSEGTDRIERKGHLVTISLGELSEYLSGDISRPASLLHDAGGFISTFAITDLGSNYAEAIEELRISAPHCLESKQHGGGKLPVAVMADGSPRRTYATEEGVYPECISTPMAIISSAFDTVESMVTQVIQKFSGHRDPLSYTTQNRRKSVSIEDAPVKDHLHVYSKSPSEVNQTSGKDDFLVPFHIDNGLFLLLTPFPSPSLLVTLSNGHSLATSGLTTDSILVLVGRGLTDWLFQDEETKFFAVPHAVPSLATSKVHHRSVFARMKVVPMDALPVGSKSSKKSQKKFGSIFYETAPSPKTATLCTGSSSFSPNSRTQSAYEFIQGNILQCNNQTDAYCWMNCLPLPSTCTLSQAECYNQNHEPCNTVDAGEPHDATCAWHCKDPGPTPDDDAFCSGGMDMLMNGFDVAGGGAKKTCVILFFTAWKLNSAGKFAAACFGVFFLGLSIEILIAFRRYVVSKKRLFVRLPLPAKKILIVALFGANLVLGYLAMLVAMTYSVELFICVVIGIIVGHALLNSHVPVGETIDPCCASQNQNKQPEAATSGHRSPVSVTACDNALYEGVAVNGGAHGHDGADGGGADDDASLCHCDARSYTKLKV